MSAAALQNQWPPAAVEIIQRVPRAVIVYSRARKRTVGLGAQWREMSPEC